MKKRINNWVVFISILFISTTFNAQSQKEDKAYYKLYNNSVGIENNEINNGRYYNKKYRTIENTHVFFKSYIPFEGIVTYKNQIYYTKLKYDIVNDLIIVKYINEKSAFSLSLTPELVEEVVFNNHKFVILPSRKNLHSIYKNGLFEEVFFGDNFSLYIKHIKRMEEKYQMDILSYLAVKQQVFIIKYKNQFHKITKRKELFKAFPEFRKDIEYIIPKDKKITPESLLELVKQLNK